MKLSTSITIAAASFAAAFIFSGCATHRQAVEIQNQLDQIEAQNQQMASRVAAMDSTIANESLESRKIRADLNTTIDDLQRQISSLLANYNDLMQKIDDLRKVPRSVSTNSTSTLSLRTLRNSLSASQKMLLSESTATSPASSIRSCSRAGARGCSRADKACPAA